MHEELQTPNSVDSMDSFTSDFFDQPDDNTPSGFDETNATGQPDFDKSLVADLVAKYGSSSATAWLEFSRYRIWQAEPNQVPESSFPPVQGYMTRKHWVFAWGDPLVSDPKALEPTAKAFVAWGEAQGFQVVWCCADLPLEKALAKQGWSTVECIYEDRIEPDHVVELTSPDSKGHQGQHVIKDLKKNLRRADKAGVQIVEVTGQWTDEMRQQVNLGIEAWKKQRNGPQIASTTFQAFTDEEHRRYWVATLNKKIVGILILTPIGNDYLIKNAASFPDAPRGTSEALIHRAVEIVHKEEQMVGHSITLSFGITASDEVKPKDNLSGWKIKSLSKVYNSVALSAGLLRRADFRHKFDSAHQPMYVCYSHNFGVEGIRALLKVLKT